jgi:hypothetical protein
MIHHFVTDVECLGHQSENVSQLTNQYPLDDIGHTSHTLNYYIITINQFSFIINRKNNPYNQFFDMGFPDLLLDANRLEMLKRGNYLVLLWNLIWGI